MAPDPTAPTPETANSRAAIQAQLRQEAKRRRRRWPRRLLVSALALVVLAGLLVVGGYVYAGYRFDQIHKVHHLHLVKVAAPGKPFNVLMVGSDTRAFVTNAVQAHAFGTSGTEGGQRSDVTIVARFVPATRQVYLMSIPRDLWVHIPGDVPGVSGMNRINAAFNNGPDLLIQTIERDLHIPINHYVSVNFNGFQDMVNALGGITLDFPMELRDQYSGLRVTTTGCQQVPGTTALELVRARHVYYYDDGYWKYDGLSDFSRIQRQDVFFRAVLTKVGNELLNPFVINGFIGAAVQSLAIDDTITKSDLLRWAEEFHGATGSNLKTMTLPTTGFVTDGGADVLNEAQPYANQMIYLFNLIGVPHPSPSPRPTTTTTTTTTVPVFGATTSTTTTTTIPSDVYTNTQPEPWNPTLCQT